MKVLHFLSGGHAGGIEILCREIGEKSTHRNGFCFLSHGGEIYEQMTGLGHITYPLYKLGKKWSFKKLAKIFEIAKEYDIVIVHHEDPFLELYFLFTIFIERIPGIRYVHSCYNDEVQFDANKVKRMFKRMMRQWSLFAARQIIFVSEAGKRSCEEGYRFNERKSRIIYNGGAERYLIEGEDHQIKIGEPMEILYVGRLAAIKGLDILLKAIARLKEKYRVHLSLVGDGEQRQFLERLADKLQLIWKEGVTEGCDVTFYGVQTDIVPFLKKAMLFVYPSVCQEVFGLSIVEAMAFGIPCIGNCVGGIPEVIEDGRNGFLTKTMDVDGMYDAIKRILETMKDENVFQDMSDEAKRTAQCFGIENTCKALDREWEKLAWDI
ncbi:MAG: glycosyltransferase family 4 protein [Lachnospiraceae bacterium]|jgi:glycosyltransferase involved in cell wall biosynthesis|nr:glycosyltransferase family 4 protein [Lachnospiraceae bacterium]